MGLLDGKVAITRAREAGSVRPTAKLFAREGGRWWFNDLGGPREGEGRKKHSAK